MNEEEFLKSFKFFEMVGKKTAILFNVGECPCGGSGLEANSVIVYGKTKKELSVFMKEAEYRKYNEIQVNNQTGDCFCYNCENQEVE